MIIARVDITPAEFDRRKDRLRSRWAPLIDNLKGAFDGEVFSVCLRGEENTGRARHQARQAIYAIARYHQIQIKICSTPLAILVMRVSGPKLRALDDASLLAAVVSSNFDNL
jgi:hypothetical protein